MNNVKENICVLYVNILGVADFFFARGSGGEWYIKYSGSLFSKSLQGFCVFFNNI